MFATRDDVLHWACFVAYDIGFVTVIMRSDTYTRKSGRTSYVLIGCERSEKYRAYMKGLVRTMTSSRKCGCPFKFRAKPMLGGEGWMVNLICEATNLL